MIEAFNAKGSRERGILKPEHPTTHIECSVCGTWFDGSLREGFPECPRCSRPPLLLPER